MSLPLLCDEHVPFQIVEGLRRRRLDVAVVQEIGLRSSDDLHILEVAQQLPRVIYTQDTDFLRHHAAGVQHGGLLYHHPLDYSIGEAIRRVELVCEVYSLDDMKNRLEFL